MRPTIVEPKPGVDMGRLVVDVLVENFQELERAGRGEIPAEKVRNVRVQALVDSGATFLCLPQRLVDQLGLALLRHKEARTAMGVTTPGIYGAAKVSVQDRDCVTEVMALPDNCQPLLGQIPLEIMDYWVDLTNRRLVGNPEHGGQWMAEVYVLR